MNAKSIRLFQNNALEALTHVHPIVPLVFWSPVIVLLLWRSATVHALPAWQIAALLLPALLTWTLVEYLVHRFLFHYRASSRAGRWLIYLFHGVHHDAPNDKSRLVMPPAGALPIMAAIYLVISLAIPAPLVEAFFAFFLVGYLIYDYLHYATHHFRMRHPWLQAIKRKHMQHHFRNSKASYGVSSPLWDLVFRTVS